MSTYINKVKALYLFLVLLSLGPGFYLDFQKCACISNYSTTFNATGSAFCIL